MCPERRSQGNTLSRTRTVVEPVISVLFVRRGDGVCQRIGTDGKRTTVPLSSIAVVSADAIPGAATRVAANNVQAKCRSAVGSRPLMAPSSYTAPAPYTFLVVER
jgi:hypothetical protein